MKKIILLILIATLSSSCASILNGKYQKIAIYKSSNSKVLVNGKKGEVKKGMYLVKRDKLPKQITITRDGYKDENIVIMQYKRSPLYIMSWIPFAVLIYPPFYDVGNKAFNYTNEVRSNKKAPALVNKDEDAKEIMVNKASVSLKANNINYRFFPSYKNYLRKDEKREAKSLDTDEEINIQNSIFSLALNDMLREKGYIDTTQTVLKNSYLNNLLINSNIKSYTVHHIANNYLAKYGGMVYVDLTIDWEILDYYEKPIYSQTTSTRSGQFAIIDYDDRDQVIRNSVKDAIEFGFIEFMNSPRVNELMYDKSELATEKSFEDIIIPQTNAYVSSLSQAVKSSVTIKLNNGHGSGFVISEDGYIITNYHVVSDTDDAKVILNDGSEYDFDVVRVSKIYDLALLKIDADNLTPFKISSTKDIEIATDVYAVGTPSAQDLSQTVSKGIISGIRNTDNGSKLIQTDASINSGNSGGAIVTKDGVVLGVVSSKLKGFGIEGVAFGIPSYELLDKLKISVR